MPFQQAWSAAMNSASDHHGTQHGVDLQHGSHQPMSSAGGNTMSSSPAPPSHSDSTQELIAEYDARIAGRFDKAHLGSSRHQSRQAKINAIVDEISRRADDGDHAAITWYGG